MRAIRNESKQDFATPRWFMDQLEAEIAAPYDLDPCCWAETAVAPLYWTPVEDGLAQPWGPLEDRPTRVFVNPPWADPHPWIEKALREVELGHCDRVTFLLASKTDTKWFKRLFDVSEIWFIQPRLNYWDGERLKAGIAFGSALFHIGRNCQPGVARVFEAIKPKGATR